MTCSGSGLDPHISPAAAEFQVARIAKAAGRTETEVREIIQTCTDSKFLGVFGEESVNVLKVNLMLDGIYRNNPRKNPTFPRHTLRTHRFSSIGPTAPMLFFMQP